MGEVIKVILKFSYLEGRHRVERKHLQNSSREYGEGEADPVLWD